LAYQYQRVQNDEVYFVPGNLNSIVELFFPLFCTFIINITQA